MVRWGVSQVNNGRRVTQRCLVMLKISYLQNVIYFRVYIAGLRSTDSTGGLVVVTSPSYFLRSWVRIRMRTNDNIEIVLNND